MPIEAYFKGHGTEVAAAMKKRYGKNWKKYFYGRANKLHLTPGDKHGAIKSMLGGGR